MEVYQVQVEKKVGAMNFGDESGFEWLPFGKLEFQFYNIRHIHHHTGELWKRLGEKGNIEVNWVGMRDIEKNE